jgi:hypothetical protein
LRGHCCKRGGVFVVRLEVVTAGDASAVTVIKLKGEARKYLFWRQKNKTKGTRKTSNRDPRRFQSPRVPRF